MSCCSGGAPKGVASLSQGVENLCERISTQNAPPIRLQHLLRAVGVVAATGLSAYYHPKAFTRGAAIGALVGLSNASYAYWKGERLHVVRPLSGKGGGCVSGLSDLLGGGNFMSEERRRVQMAVLMAAYYRTLSELAFVATACFDFPRRWGAELAHCLHRPAEERSQLAARLLPWDGVATSSWRQCAVRLARVAVVSFSLYTRPRIALLGLLAGVAAGYCQGYSALKNGESLDTLTLQAGGAQDGGGCSSAFARMMSGELRPLPHETTLRVALLLALHLHCRQLGRFFAVMTAFEYLSPVAYHCYQATPNEEGENLAQRAWRVLGQGDVQSLVAAALVVFAAYRHPLFTLFGAGTGIAWGCWRQHYRPPEETPPLLLVDGCAPAFTKLLNRGLLEPLPLQQEAESLVTLVAHAVEIPRMAAYVGGQVFEGLTWRPLSN